MIEAEGGGMVLRRESEGERQKRERDVKMSSSGVSSFPNAQGKPQLQWKIPEGAQPAMPEGSADQGVGI